jgi:hypothetical protein
MTPWQKQHSDAALAACPSLADLRTLLLSMGGEIVCDWNLGATAEDVTRATTRLGMLWPVTGRKTMQGSRNDCHENAKLQQERYPHRYRAITGFALSTDGIWRQHSWAFDFKDGKLADTIFGSANRKYFGYPEFRSTASGAEKAGSTTERI